jgi:transcriptional regulator with XRE-family HTH domain
MRENCYTRHTFVLKPEQVCGRTEAPHPFLSWSDARVQGWLLDESMEDPGRQLRRVREQLRLRYRDVEEASQQIARNRDNQEFLIGLSRLADIENKGTLPTLYRLYSLCVIYGLNFRTVLTWYGIHLEDLASDSAKLSLRETRLLHFISSDLNANEIPIEIDQDIDLSKTLYLSPHIKRWGTLPLSVLGSLDLERHRYGFIGTDDWFMYPILPPGSFVQIDETRKRLTSEGLAYEHERPIHFIEHRGGYRCGWCTERSGFLIVQPHSASNMSLEIYRYPGEVDILGQVVGVAKRLDLARRRHIRS